MRIDIGQTTNLFHADAFNKNISSNEQEKKETKGINILPRKDAAVISPMGKASSALQNLVNQIETGQESSKYQNSQTDSSYVNDESSPETVNYQVSKEGRENFQYQAENGTAATLSDKKLDIMEKIQQESMYFDEIMEKSDDGFTNPTIKTQLKDAYIHYLDNAFEKGQDPEENVYDYIVNIHKNSLMKAYQDVYNDIVAGYENGTREVWTQDFEEGADYIEFEQGGKNYRFHKLTMEEELARLDSAYEKEAKNVEDAANLMIDTQKVIEKVMPEYQKKMRQIAEQLVGRKMSETEKITDIEAERIRNKISMAEQNTERVNLFEMLMEERKNWLNVENGRGKETGSTDYI